MQVETFNYNENDINNISNMNYKSKLDECIYSIVKKEGYISADITKKAIPADGGNYLGVLYEIDVNGRTNDGDKKTAIFVKSMSEDCSAMELISIPSVYKTELYVYKELIKIFNDLQDEANVPDEGRFRTVKCYEESYDQAIIMENMAKKGFKTWNRMNKVTLDMAEACIIQLGRFHGLSFVLEQKMPDYFEKKIKSFKTAYQFGKVWDGFVDKFYKMGMERLDENIRSKVGKKIRNILNKMEEYHTEESIKYCLCHADFRPNNVLYREVDRNTTEVVTLDFQLIYYGCPILDFIYFVYLSTDREFRRAHITNLKNLYYKSLDEFLQHFDISVESVFPRKVFENLYQEKMDNAVMLAFLLFPFMFVSEDGDVPDVAKQPIEDIEFNVDKRFDERLKETIEEFIELGYL